jgi:hypothetical protein
MFLSQCPGASWEVDCAELNARWSMCFLGDLAGLAEQTTRIVRLAKERGDLVALMNTVSGFPNVVWLLSDDVGGARREAAEACSAWSHSGFHLQHFLDVYSRVHVELYLGDGASALSAWSARRTELRRSGLLQVQINRILSYDLEGRAAVAAAISAGMQRRHTVSRASASARRLHAEERAWASALAFLLEAQVALIEAGSEQALPLLQKAAAELTKQQMTLHAAAADALAGGIRGGDEGRALVLRAHAMLSHQGAKRPERILAMLAPGLDAMP